MNIPLMIGYNLISASSDTLAVTDLLQIYTKINTGEGGLDRLTAQLRRVGGIDPKAYSNLKRQLPYLTCGVFSPPVRKTENFSSIESFVLDFDHLSEKQTDPETLKKRIQGDDRAALIFTSPGGDGLKVLLVLSEPIKDYGKFSVFYKLFAVEFARMLGLQQVIDKKTSDVTRATFLCYDPLAWYNPLYTTVNVADWINFESSLEVDEAIELGKQLESEFKQAQLDDKPDTPVEDPLPDETLLAIRKKLNPAYKPRGRKRSFYVPEKVEKLEVEIRARCNEVGIELSQCQEIQYGKQFEFKAGEHIAELNVFFGKRGFSVVKSTKTLCSAGLNDIVYNIVMELIET